MGRLPFRTGLRDPDSSLHRKAHSGLGVVHTSMPRRVDIALYARASVVICAMSTPQRHALEPTHLPVINKIAWKVAARSSTAEGSAAAGTTLWVALTRRACGFFVLTIRLCCTIPRKAERARPIPKNE